MNTNTAIGQWPVGLRRVRRVLWEEFDAFCNDFAITPVPEMQNLRGFLTAWFCTLLPEVVTPAFRSALVQQVQQVRTSDSFRAEGWWKNLLMDMAAFGLTNDPYYLEVHRLNLDHHNQELRTFLLLSFALAAPRLSFEDNELRTRVAYNLSISHCFCEWHAVFLLATKGDTARKREELDRWLRDYRLNPAERELLEHVREWGHCQNSFFLEHFLHTASYLAIRLTAAPLRSDGADRDPDLHATGLFDEAIGCDLAKLYWERVTDHPLMSSVIVFWERDL